MAIKRPRFQAKKKRRQINAGQGKSRFKQGFYQPVNPEKFRCSKDPTMNSGEFPFYRSSWELIMYKYFDNHKDVEYWGTESVAIRYISPKDGQPHRYFPDIFVKWKNSKKTIIEIKPDSQTSLPINEAKFKAAREVADKLGAEFIVITEKHLKSWGLLK
jgi:hypothetical protein